MQCSVIILAAGLGKRMDQKTPKQFLMLGGKPIIIHTLERLERIAEVGEIIIVTLQEYVTQLEDMISNRLFEKQYYIIQGGTTRQASTRIGLAAAQYDTVIIHEAARPFVKTEEFQTLLRQDAYNVIYGSSIPFTVVGGSDKIEELYERSYLVNVQLPQKFLRQPLLRAHQKAQEDGREFTEDASVLYFYEHADISIVKGKDYNIKITNPTDLIIGEQIYREYILGGETN